MKSILTLMLAGAFVAQAADQASPAELKMREALRNTMMQLRTAETERANLQAANTELAEKNKANEAKIAALTKQLADDKAASDKAASDLSDKVSQRDGEIVQLKESLEKWKVGHAQITGIAKAKEAERARLEAKAIQLDRTVADQQRKNETMFKLGNEILDRYEKFGLGDALLGREQFIGITRVKFENLMQDYSDKLTDAKIKPAPAPAAPAKRVKSTPAPKSKGDEKPSKPAKGTRALS